MCQGPFRIPRIRVPPVLWLSSHDLNSYNICIMLCRRILSSQSRRIAEHPQIQIEWISREQEDSLVT